MDIKEKLMELIDIGSGCPDGKDPFGDFCESCRYKESTMCHLESLADYLIANGVTMQESKGVEIDQFNKWIPASEPPGVYRDKYRQLIPFLVCTAGQEYPFKTFYDGKKWGARGQDVSVTHWMPLPEPPKGSS